MPEAPRQTIRRDPRPSTHRDDGSPLQAGYGHEVYSLFARRSGEPLARLRLTGNGDEVVLLYPSHRGGWGALGDFGASAMSLDKALQCLSDNPYFLDLRETYG